MKTIMESKTVHATQQIFKVEVAQILSVHWPTASWDQMLKPMPMTTKVTIRPTTIKVRTTGITAAEDTTRSLTTMPVESRPPTKVATLVKELFQLSKKKVRSTRPPTTPVIVHPNTSSRVFRTITSTLRVPCPRQPPEYPRELKSHSTASVSMVHCQRSTARLVMPTLVADAIATTTKLCHLIYWTSRPPKSSPTQLKE